LLFNSRGQCRWQLPTCAPLGLLRRVHSFISAIERTGHWAPWLFFGLFLAASFLMIWRLECIADSGVEGTVLGTLVMPYCSGIGNLIFAYVAYRDGRPASDVFISCLVNNVTNMTLILGLPAIIWGLNILPAKKSGGGKARKSNKKRRVNEVNRLSLLLTLLAVLFFTGTTWALGADGKFGFNDGLVLVGFFLFWQCIHVFDVLKANAQQNKSLSWLLVVDLAILGVGAYGVYVSTDWLVGWVSKIPEGLISNQHVGWLSGWMNVLPNAMLAIYYAHTQRPAVVYTSQVGDSHICIPLCIGIYALFKPIQTPAFFALGVMLLFGATLLHILCIGVLGRLPRLAGVLLVAAYIYFLLKGLLL
jgi:cation:H+ antiporter